MLILTFLIFLLMLLNIGKLVSWTKPTFFLSFKEFSPLTPKIYQKSIRTFNIPYRFFSYTARPKPLVISVPLQKTIFTSEELCIIELTSELKKLEERLEEDEESEFYGIVK